MDLYPLEERALPWLQCQWNVEPPLDETVPNTMGRARQVPEMDDPLSNRCSTYKRDIHIYIYTVCIAYNILYLLLHPLEEASPLEEGPLLYASFGRGKNN